MTKKETIVENEPKTAVLIEGGGYLILLDMRHTNYENGYRQSALYVGKILVDKTLTKQEKAHYVNTIENFCFMIDKNVDKTNKPIRKYTLASIETEIPKTLNNSFEVQIVDIDPENKIEYPDINENLKLWLELFNCANCEELEALKHKSEMMYNVVTKIQEKFKEEETF